MWDVDEQKYLSLKSIDFASSYLLDLLLRICSCEVSTITIGGQDLKRVVIL